MVSVSLGPLALSLNQLMMILAFGVAWATAAFLSRRDELALGARLFDLVLLALFAARLGFVIRYFPEYSDNWLGMLDIRDGGFSPLAGIAGAAFGALVLALRHPGARAQLAVSLGTGVAVWALLSTAAAVMRGQGPVLAETPVQTLTGKQVRPAAFRPEQPRVINLWASWCPPCVDEMPVLEKAAQRYPGVSFIFVNQGEDRARVRGFLEQHGLELSNVLLDPESNMGRAGGQALPTTLFYDASGQLIDTHVGALSRASLRSALEGFDSHYLQEKAP
jgi:thiol-disulfide isomerase/thioredoxin